MFKIRLVILIFVMMITLVGCENIVNSRQAKSYSKDFFALDTHINIRVDEHEEGEKIIESAMERIRDLEKKMSISIKTSDVYQINQMSGIEPVKVSEETFYVIRRAVEYANLTDGLFDITLYPIIKLWDINSIDGSVPDEKEVLEKLSLVDYEKIFLDEEKQEVFLKKEGMMIDLGGIAKGFIGDQILELLKDEGVEHAIINLGGDVLVIGDRVDGTPWRIGVADPRLSRASNQHFAVVSASNEVVVTSGNYERFLEKAYDETGIKYHHIFDPRTGYPSTMGIASVTIVSDYAIDADVLATALFNMTIEEGVEVIKGLDGFEALIVDKNMNYSKTDGIEVSFN